MAQAPEENIPGYANNLNGLLPLDKPLKTPLSTECPRNTFTARSTDPPDLEIENLPLLIRPLQQIAEAGGE
jgi:hypothetical protein